MKKDYLIISFTCLLVTAAALQMLASTKSSYAEIDKGLSVETTHDGSITHLSITYTNRALNCETIKTDRGFAVVCQ